MLTALQQQMKVAAKLSSVLPCTPAIVPLCEELLAKLMHEVLDSRFALELTNLT